jgi:phosphoribosyl 1,2-cyclic phosphate phosphodiesterase
MQQRNLSITLLGTGTSTGIPVVGCSCAVCSSSDPHNQRTRCSALISDGEQNILIDSTPDLRFQALREKIPRIDAVFYTHGHADHLHGIDDLRIFSYHSKTPIPLYGSAQTLSKIAHSFGYIFNRNTPWGQAPNLQLRPIEATTTVGALRITPIPMKHGHMDSFGYRCGPIAYLTDCNYIPPSSIELLNDLELLVLDALRFEPHPTHFSIPEAVAMAQRIGAKQTLLTHFSHDVDHETCSRQLPPGIGLGYDGLKFTFPLPDA